ncbi:MAG: polymer-forming cytoskeletal protein [Spirochaetota bacterium]
MPKYRINRPKDKLVSALNATWGGGHSADTTSVHAHASLIAEGTLIEGELRFGSNLYFAGKLEGSIAAPEGNLKLSKCGVVNGDIDCGVLDCYGEVVGNIQVRGKSTLRNHSKLVGDIRTEILSIQSGAQINGSCKMLGDKAEMDFFSMPIENLRKHLKSEK